MADAVRSKAGGARPAARDEAAGPAVLDRPLTSLHLVLVSGGLLLAIGLLMVLSASMFASYVDLGTTYGVFARQLTWVGIGLPVFWLGLRLSPRAHRALAYPAMVFAVFLLMAVLVPGIGTSLHGARRWIDFGPLQLQPSEPAKLALTLWGADLLVRKHKLLRRTRHLALPLLPVAAGLAGLVMLEPDLGTTLCFGLVLFGLLWTVGAPSRFFGLLAGVAAVAVLFLVLVEPYRMARIPAYLDPVSHSSDTGYQAVQGLYSLSTGGWFGVGLGQSKMKWGLLPNAHTDYIFAIIGEELGLVGCLVVILLFATLVYAGVRIARRSADPFARLAAAAVTTWIAGQAVINMGYVTGLLPVTGIPLPLISFGGTSLVVTLYALGMLASFARHEPAAVGYLRGRRRGWASKLLWLPPPQRYRPSRAATGPARPGPAQSGAAQSGAARPGPAQSGAAQSGPARSGAAQSGAARSGAARSRPAQGRATPGRATPGGRR
jgi:cell division protein FtsW